MDKGKKEFDPADLLSGTLNILGIKFDLRELLVAPEDITGRLEDLREKLKQIGAKPVLSDEEWRQGGTSITGQIRTRGLLGEREYHIGVAGGPKAREKASPGRPEMVEPPVDVFVENDEVTIVADIPGVGLEDLELTAEGSVFSLSTKAIAPRGYRKELRLEAEIEPGSLRATCRNGVLEVRVQKRAAAKGQRSNG